MKVLRDLLNPTAYRQAALLLVGGPQRPRRKLAGKIQEELEDIRGVSTTIMVFVRSALWQRVVATSYISPIAPGAPVAPTLAAGAGPERD
jgi:hypothetical protein